MEFLKFIQFSLLCLLVLPSKGFEHPSKSSEHRLGAHETLACVCEGEPEYEWLKESKCTFYYESLKGLYHTSSQLVLSQLAATWMMLMQASIGELKDF